MILVTGGTGTVGGELVRLLVERGADVRLLARDPAKVAVEGVQVVAGDLSRPETLAPAFDGVDHSFHLTPGDPDQYTLHANLIEAAKAAGDVHVVKMGAVGTSLDSAFAAGRQFARSDELLEASGLDWTLLHPHAFMQNLLASAVTISGEGVLYGTTGNGKIGTIDARDIALVAATVLTEPGHAGKAYRLTGPESLSYADMATRLSAALGREVSYVDMPPDAYGEALRGFGMPAPVADDLVTLYGHMFRDGEGDYVTSDVEDITGAPPRSLDQFARDYASAFQTA